MFAFWLRAHCCCKTTTMGNRLPSVLSFVLHGRLNGKAAAASNALRCRLSFDGCETQQPVVHPQAVARQCIGGPASESCLPACPCSACCLGGSLTSHRSQGAASHAGLAGRSAGACRLPPARLSGKQHLHCTLLHHWRRARWCPPNSGSSSFPCANLILSH